ncbi:pentapeptide repeat-containing protein [Streptomyces sp. NRRL S-237]|uniref:pentapeptide repeat-containing protein n=1 Tax=Streptomyces sp. NRRL S-237 TaxID=1463895 RepID=UPI00131B16FE|nr:pentapeptide repeat-containing protein [Streptomyces sp. NRRL S-237]
MPNSPKRHSKQEGRHTPNLSPVWLVAPVALILVGALAYGLYHGTDALLSSRNAGKNPVSVQDVIKTTVTVLTLIGAVLAALYAYRKQLLDEGASHRADATQLAERYAKAAEQLGHDQAAVRLAGVYAMARLADDWPEQRQVCVNVLCAYLRMPYEPEPTRTGFKLGEKEVRLTIIRTIRDHLQDPQVPTTWCGLDLDFTGAVFDGGDFSGSVFSGGAVDFRAAVFSGVFSFTKSIFSGGTVYFANVTFSSGTLYFTESTFSGGEVHFTRSEFSGGHVAFFESTFSGGHVAFFESKFSGGEVSFRNSTFSGGRVDFRLARFDGSEVSFNNSTFSGSTVEFGGSGVSSGLVSLSFAVFSSGAINFERSVFYGGEVNFHSSTLNGTTADFTNLRVHAAADIDWGPFPAISVNRP